MQSIAPVFIMFLVSVVVANAGIFYLLHKALMGDKMNEVEIQKAVDEIVEMVSMWPDGNLKSKVFYYLKNGNLSAVKSLIKNPPGSEIVMSDGASYLIDRHGTYIRKRE